MDLAVLSQRSSINS